MTPVTPLQEPAEGREATTVFPTPLTQAQKEALVADIREWNKKPGYKEYIERGNIAVAEYRQQLDDEMRRYLDEAEGK